MPFDVSTSICSPLTVVSARNLDFTAVVMAASVIAAPALSATSPALAAPSRLSSLISSAPLRAAAPARSSMVVSRSLSRPALAAASPTWICAFSSTVGTGTTSANSFTSPLKSFAMVMTVLSSALAMATSDALLKSLLSAFAT